MHSQCPAVYIKHRGKRVTAVFCTKMKGHDGKHKGFRREWADGEGDQPLDARSRDILRALLADREKA